MNRPIRSHKIFISPTELGPAADSPSSLPKVPVNILSEVKQMAMKMTSQSPSNSN